VFAALLDTCVLVPSRARDVLLEVAAQSVYRPLWSEAILAELRRTVELLAIKRGRDAQEVQSYSERLLLQMSNAFPDALVVGWEPLETGFTLPDTNDRHVLAAAVIGRADIIVTDNLKHFPAELLPPFLRAQSLDEFLLDALDLHPTRVVAAVTAVAERTGRNGPRRTTEELAVDLANNGAQEFSKALVDALRGSAHESKDHED
jgi:predicted nucleic acid-binding protein